MLGILFTPFSFIAHRDLNIFGYSIFWFWVYLKDEWTQSDVLHFYFSIYINNRYSHSTWYDSFCLPPVSPYVSSDSRTSLPLMSKLSTVSSVVLLYCWTYYYLFSRRFLCNVLFLLLSFYHCFVFPSCIDDFWLLLWHLQAFTDSM